MLKRMLFLLFLSLSGCAVYGGGYDAPYYGGYDYRYNDGYRRDYYPPQPVYVVPGYYEDRRYGYPQERRHVPPPPPPRYSQPPRYRDDYPRHEPPRYNQQRDSRRYEQRGGGIPRGGWQSGDRRYSQGRYQQPNGQVEQGR